MSSRIARLTVVVAVLVLVFVAVFVVNQTAQVVSLANTVGPGFGRLVLAMLLVVYAGIVLAPIIVFARLPKPLRPPDDDQSPEFQSYLRQLGARLATQPEFAGMGMRLDERAAIERAVQVLDAQATELIRSTAAMVFISTAISQSGRLDGIMVLAAQSRLVWRIAHLYYQRPSLREMVHLYANIAATVFLVTELDDMDIDEQVQPVIASALAASTVSVVPGASVVATLITQAMLDGAANAFLSLRIGVLCQRYCGALTAMNRRTARRHASLTAAKMLGPVVAGSAAVVLQAVLDAARKAGSETLGTLAGSIRSLGRSANPFGKRSSSEKGS